MKPILEIHSVSKKFNIRHANESYLSLRDRLTQFAKLKFSKKSDEHFWALRDVNLDIMPGESVGIIGKNGAGKSTLLKILCKITPPTKGKIIGRGRIASLLEVGTGFHPELTGRENVYLNGSILGMKRTEISAKFDEIVDFAGTEKFLDTPLKQYSSGMQLRLAFSVAAFLEPEILIIDEVLAVGDSEFQKKCIGKMENVRKKGRTILFVSHNMSAIMSLCSRALLLENGRIISLGTPENVIQEYTHKRRELKKNWVTLANGFSLTNFKLDKQEINDGQSLNYAFQLTGEVPNPISGLALLIYNELNERVAIIDLRSENLFIKSRAQANLRFSGTIHGVNLIDGVYHIGIFIASNFSQGDFYDLASFRVTAHEKDAMPYDRQYRGFVSFLHNGRLD